MQIDELCKKYSIDEISQKTLISPRNLEALFAEEYVLLSKAKTLGFLSILEREYTVNIEVMRSNALAHFGQSTPISTRTTAVDSDQKQKKGLGKYIVVVLVLLASVGWYFFIYLDTKVVETTLQKEVKVAALPVSSTKATESNVSNTSSSNSIIAKVKEYFSSTDIPEITEHNVTPTIATIPTDEPNSTNKGFMKKIKDFFVSKNNISSEEHIPVVKSSSIVVLQKHLDNTSSENVHTIAEENNLIEKSFVEKIKDFLFSFSSNETRETTSYHNSVVVENSDTSIRKHDTMQKETHTKNTKLENQNAYTQIRIEPVKYLWFGLVNVETGKRDYYSIRKPYTLDVSKNTWLVATNSSAFSLVSGGNTKYFSTSVEHYFYVTQENIEVLKRDEYIAKGGYDKW